MDVWGVFEREKDELRIETEDGNRGCGSCYEKEPNEMVGSCVEKG